MLFLAAWTQHRKPNLVTLDQIANKIINYYLNVSPKTQFLLILIIQHLDHAFSEVIKSDLEPELGSEHRLLVGGAPVCGEILCSTVRVVQPT